MSNEANLQDPDNESTLPTLRFKYPVFQKIQLRFKGKVLFLTCSDCPLHPQEFTATTPESILTLQIIANVIAPYNEVQTTEMETLQYALDEYCIQDIIICGHTQCASLKHLISTEPFLAGLKGTCNILKTHYQEESDEDLNEISVQINVLNQIENLMTYPPIATAFQSRKLRFHGWVYETETATLSTYDHNLEKFVPLREFYEIKDIGSKDWPYAM